MPNWCFNHITITGPADDIAAFNIALPRDDTGHVSLLTTFHPIPDDAQDDWYRWSIDNWGTKWPDECTVRAVGPTTLSLTGDTAWSPPVAGLAAIGKQWPTLTFTITYDEPGMCFYGAAVIQGHRVLDHCCAYPDVDFPDWEDTDSVDAFHDLILGLRDEAARTVHTHLQGATS